MPGDIAEPSSPRVINMGPGPPGWELGVGLTTPPSKNCLLGNQKCGLRAKVWRRSIMEAKARIGPMKKI
jgi:hypothetical protein